MIRALYLLFVLSGAAGLIYESTWTRYLGLFVGHDAYAQIIVLVIFLGGMSAGALAVSRQSARFAQPLYGYVGVEFAVGIIGLFFHDVFQTATSWAYTSVYPEARRHVDAAGRQVGHRERTHPSTVGTARRHVPSDVGGRAAPRSGCTGTLARHALLRQQSRRRRRRPHRRVSTSCRWPASPARSSPRRCSTSSWPARRSV